MDERRRDPRYPASWPVRLWLTDERFLFGRVVDASRHGMHLAWSKLAPTDDVTLGASYRVEVRPEPHTGVRCLVVVRHRTEDGVGVETRDDLPVDWLRLQAERSETRPESWNRAENPPGR